MFVKILNTTIILSCVLFVPNGSIGQNSVENHYQKLKKIREEIRSVESEIAANEKKASTVLFVLTNLDLDIDLTQTFIQKLKKEQKQKEKQISRIEQDLKKTEEELQRLKEAVSKRLVYFYKYGRLKDLELLLTAKSINQGLLWIEYQKRLSAHDKRNYLKIKQKQAQIARDRERLKKELTKKQKLLQEKLAEEKKLKEKKEEREKVLSSIRKTTELYRQELAEKRQAEVQITRLILRLEKAPEDEPLIAPETLFADLQGRMIWPTHGKIVAKFGRYKHPELKTVTENIGIDIRADQGSPVRAVASGRVTVITWQRGRGNIVIVKHYGGYYTVYAHLKEILVTEAQEIQRGQVIGSVGESGSISGPLLHFEIWQGTEKLNPEKWLAVQS